MPANEIRNQTMITVETGVVDAKLEALAGDLDRLTDILTGILHAVRRMHQVDLAELRYLDAQNARLRKQLRDTEAERLELSKEAHPSNYRWGAR